MASIYLIGSLRNPNIPLIGNKLRSLGFDVFDDWHEAGKDADLEWQEHEQIRGRTYKEALNGYHAWYVFNFDKTHLDRCDICVLVMPAGRSGHIELGYAIGRGKRGYVLFDKEPDKFDCMYRFAADVFYALDDLVRELKQ